VLVVDDEVSIRTVAERALTRRGFTVISADNGVDGVEMFREHADEILAVVLDLTLPQLSGEQVFRQICEIRTDVQVILCSGYNEEEATRRFKSANLVAFLEKPYRPAVLLELLGKLLKPV